MIFPVLHISMTNDDHITKLLQFVSKDNCETYQECGHQYFSLNSSYVRIKYSMPILNYIQSTEPLILYTTRRVTILLAVIF